MTSKDAPNLSEPSMCPDTHPGLKVDRECGLVKGILLTIMERHRK